MAGNESTRPSDQPVSREGHEDTIPAAESEPPAPIPVAPPSAEAQADASPKRPSIRPSIAPPVQPERYRLGAELGRGGMGRVVEAFDVQLGRTVALKEVLPKAGGTSTNRRFAREVQLTARLEHPAIVPLYDAGTSSDGRPYYVMRRVSGRPLDELMARSRGIDERLTLLPAVLAAINAVAHAHRRGVIHRDLKPANILVGELGETIVIDWGLAKVVGEKDPTRSGPDDVGEKDPGLDDGERIAEASDSLQTQMGSVFGTPGFMAPEQARGEELGPQGDVYALGATLYQLLAGIPPHAGHSATEVLDKTLRHKIVPLRDVAPGAPAELVAIVDKALAADEDKRYPDAGALGEDVRRFLAGQLVAAHRYTPAQKVVRFAKRHRAALVVAAAAAVAGAVLAWIGVTRIMTERDHAQRARDEAAAQRDAADRARLDVTERADALIVTQARALLDSNPTEAAATLKQLSHGSRRLDDARAIAQAAVVRGVAWGMQTAPEPNIIVELSPDSKQLVQIDMAGMLRVWDLERRRLVLAKSYSPMSRALWVANGKLLVSDRRMAAELLDPVANKSEPTAVPPLMYATATANGDRVLFQTPEHGVGLFDVATRTITNLGSGVPVSDIAIAHDGSWIVIAHREELVVYDATGRELVRRAGEVSRVAGARTGPSFAILVPVRVNNKVITNKVIECTLAPTPAWKDVPFEVPPDRFMIDLAYRERELVVWVDGRLLAWNGERTWERARGLGLTSGLTRAGNGVLVVANTQGRLEYFAGHARGSIALPAVVNPMRLAAREGSPRLVAVGGGSIVMFDLTSIIPRGYTMHDPFMRGTFVDDKTVLLWKPDDRVDWAWVDATTGQATRFQLTSSALVDLEDVDRTSGRVVVRRTAGTPDPDGMIRTGRMLILRANTRESQLLPDVLSWVRLIPGGGIIYGPGDGRIMTMDGAGAPREIAKIEGKFDGAIALGPMTFAVRGSTGEILRGDLRSGHIERTRVPLGGKTAMIGTDGQGRVVLAEDKRLLLWDGAVTEIARFDRNIVAVTTIEAGVALTLEDGEIHVLEVRAGARPQRLFATTLAGSRFSRDGRLVVATGNGMQLAVGELPARARWTLPLLFDTSPHTSIFAVAPSRRLVAQSSNGRLVIWELPSAGTDLAAWLDEQTNATIDPSGVFAWPWQTQRP